MFNVAMSTQTVAKCIHHVLGDVFAALMHDPRRVHRCVKRALTYLASNARRARPDRDRRTGRLKLGLEHLYGAA